MSKEYIEKEALLAQVRESRVNNTHLDSRDRHAHDTEHRHFEYMILTAKPANVAPVVRGEWIWEENEWQYRCSACRITFDYDKTYELFDHGYQYANFCPNCGMPMTEEALKILARRDGERRG